MTRHLAARASRRGALGGCSSGSRPPAATLDPPPDEPRAPAPRPDAEEPTPPTTPTPQLVRRVVDDLTAALALVGRHRPRARPAARGRSWRRGASCTPPTSRRSRRPTARGRQRVRGPLPALRARLRREETALQRRLAEAAVSARSGPLAALLATHVGRGRPAAGRRRGRGVAMSPVDALQRALAAEHAALHVYGTLGARTSASATPTLFADVTAGYTTHRARRDQLTARVRDRGRRAGRRRARLRAARSRSDTPGPGDPRRPWTSSGRARRRTRGWSGRPAAPTGGWAVTALTQTAVRELTFRGSPEIFPGAGEHADR